MQPDRSPYNHNTGYKSKHGWDPAYGNHIVESQLVTVTCVVKARNSHRANFLLVGGVAAGRGGYPNKYTKTDHPQK